MSRTADEIIRNEIGNYVIQICALIAENEALKEQLAASDNRTAKEKGVTKDASK